MKMEIRYMLEKIGIMFFIISIVFGTFLIYQQYEYKKWVTQSEINQDDNDRDYAIIELGSLRGRVEEIKKIYNDYMETVENQDKEEFYSKELYYLKCELQEIAKYKPLLPNKYLNDLNFVITKTDVGEICNELFSQISKKINNIRYGNENT